MVAGNQTMHSKQATKIVVWFSQTRMRAQNSRGIREYSLIGGGDFTIWKLIGNIGGEDFPDSVRGPLNKGGLWVERSGTRTI